MAPQDALSAAVDSSLASHEDIQEYLRAAHKSGMGAQERVRLVLFSIGTPIAILSSFLTLLLYGTALQTGPAPGNISISNATGDGLAQYTFLALSPVPPAVVLLTLSLNLNYGPSFRSFMEWCQVMLFFFIAYLIYIISATARGTYKSGPHSCSDSPGGSLGCTYLLSNNAW